ncbi:MAG TPA: peroxiredoxin [Flavobacteriales bacterium]|jgi:peroxiredoxin Q/BCP|nr:peroxiredoxin [Flavobacteriales bacterium]
MLPTGSPAPDLILPDAHGTPVRLSDRWRDRHVVLFFYPRDHTAICTKEACAFRDSYAEFIQQNTDVIGISGDDAASHASFADTYRLPFTLLTDAGGKARRAFGVPRFLGLFNGRVTFVIERGGRIRAAINDRFGAESHVRGALAALRDQRSS